MDHLSTTTEIILVCGLFVLVVFSAIFSAAETAYSSVSRAKIEQAIKDGKRSALLIRKHYHKFGRTLATVLISNNLVNIGSSSLVTYLFTDLMGANGTTTIVSTAVMTPILVIFGEIMPKLLAKKYPFRYLSLAVYLIEALNWLFWPLTYPISRMTLSSKITNTETDLVHLIKVATKEGVLDVSEATLARKALELDSTKISEVMTKKKAIISLNSHLSIIEAKKIFKESGHSRLPVKQGNKFTGVVLLKDIIYEDVEQKIDKFVKPAFYISKNMLLSKALEQLRYNRTHLALVTESSKVKDVIGLITLEDIVESLIGEIYDEHDKTQTISTIAHYKWTVLGNVSMQDVVKATKIKITVEELHMSIEEFIKQRINRRIKKGLKYTYKNMFVFKIIENKQGSEPVIQITRK